MVVAFNRKREQTSKLSFEQEPDEDQIGIDIVIIPPDVDELSGEQCDDDVGLNDAPSVDDVVGTLEIHAITKEPNKSTNVACENQSLWKKQEPSYSKFGNSRTEYETVSEDIKKHGNHMHTEFFQEEFRKFGVFNTNLAIDEMTICYFGRNNLEQFIKGKPIRFGYKLWALCGQSGYCYNLNEMKELTLGSRMVFSILECVSSPKGHVIFFNNLGNKPFHGTGTIRKNRLQKCPLKDLGILKKLKRDSLDYRCVNVATNYDAISSLATVQRKEKEEDSRITMEGVDRHDWLVGKYQTNIRRKKWYWPIFVRLLDMVAVCKFLDAL
ncbi:hypothetical protein ILUMI_27052 [Ignelater luminosus]|uniref:PiggyBac transposable element-derived protein domain-containing protein n=1 Tax=Ignelater luminosus TaxID=2038154 RepID=A0A8K0C5J1_IGNLU|nr:hypothetical protein ILUMI_27052 [Ignelater luminosus]